MTMPLQNYVDKVGPVVSAAWLNLVDRLRGTVFEDAATKAQARTALTADAPMEIVNGGTGTRTPNSSGWSQIPTFTGLMTSAGVSMGAHDSTGRGMEVCRYVSASTNTRTSTTAGALDAYLQYTLPAAGVYGFELWIPSASTSTGGMKGSVYYSGTFTAAASNYSASGRIAATPLTSAQVSVVSAVNLVNAIGATIAASDWLVVRGSVTATGVGVLGWTWCQASSDVLPTTIGQGAYMAVKQLS